VPRCSSLPLLAQLGLCNEENQQTAAKNKVEEAIFNPDSNLDCTKIVLDCTKSAQPEVKWDADVREYRG